MQHKLEEARDRSDRPAGGVDLLGFGESIVRATEEHAQAVAEGREDAEEHVYTFDPVKTRRVPRTYITKDGTEKKAALVKADFDALVCELNGDPDWLGCIRYNDFDNKIHAVRPPFPMECERGSTRLSGSDVSGLRVWLACNKDVTATVEDCTAAVELIAKAHHYHPIKNWLEKLPAPTTRHLDDLALTLFGDDRPMAQEFVRKQLVASVARLYEPGCKVDSVLTLVGSGGQKKTSTIETLYAVPSAHTFRSDLPDIRNMQAIGQALDGVWVIEMAELNVVRKTDEDALKSFLTRRVECYSPKYVAGEVIRPRQCIFWASTNDEEFLPRYDAAFRRRFWVVNVTRKVDLSWIEEHREEIWSEALAMYRAGGQESYWFDDEAMVDLIKDEHIIQDPWVEEVEKAVHSFKALREGDKTRYISSADVFKRLPGCLDKMPTDSDFKHISAVLREMPEVEKKRTKKGVGWLVTL